MVLWPGPITISLGEVISADHGLLPLRPYIECVLRGSRATYATLLATFYYLVLLRSSISRLEPVADHAEGLVTGRPLQCRRRMFLAALILAWKYTQDRHYTLSVWAKISGLCAQEIKTNEIIFLKTVEWRLYIPDAVFERWAKAMESLYPAELSGTVSSDFMLSCVEEDPDWPFRLSLLEPNERRGQSAFGFSHGSGRSQIG